MSTTLTCVYCGQAYPEGIPPHGNQVLTDHIRVCTKHPMRPLEEERNALRAALVGVVGVDGRKELEQMEGLLRLMQVPMADKAASIDAIHALLATLPKEEGVAQ